MKQIWRDIPGYEGLYQVSNTGDVKSLNYRKTGKEKLLIQTISRVGYKNVSLYNGIRRTIQVHQLVSIAFLGHKFCGYKFVINHKDFDKLNNHVDNLEIVTNRENLNRKHLKSTSQYVGVSWDKRENKWVSQIKINGKKKHLGHFRNELDASKAYQQKLKTLIKKEVL